jgi:hypothetical protein
MIFLNRKRIEFLKYIQVKNLKIYEIGEDIIKKLLNNFLTGLRDMINNYLQ